MASTNALAARRSLAQRRALSAVEKLASREQAERLRRAQLPARDNDYQQVAELEVLAEVLEELASSDAGDALDEHVVQTLVNAGYDTLESVREASDEDLLAIKGVGEKTLKEIREKVG